MRRNVLEQLDRMAFISRLSWKLNDLKNIYNINTTDPEELLSYMQDMMTIRESILEEAYNLDRFYARRKEEQNEE